MQTLVFSAEALKLIATSTLLATLLTALLNRVFSIFDERKSRKQRARYSALRTAVAIEATIAEIARRKRLVPPRSLLAAEQLLPEMPPYPGDIEWALLPPQITSAALGLPAEIIHCNDMIHDVGLGRKGGDAARIWIDHLVARASKTAGDLRSSFKLPPKDWHGHATVIVASGLFTEEEKTAAQRALEEGGMADSRDDPSKAASPPRPPAGASSGSGSAARPGTPPSG